MNVVLGSASPRRRELLGLLGIPFNVLASHVEEREPMAGEDPGSYALSLARDKAAAVAALAPDSVVLAADTVVAIDGEFLAKPRDPADAVRMLSTLRGKEHLVVTGVVVRCRTDVHEGAVGARVSMRDFSDEELAEYVASKEPMDKAGAYAVQGLGGRLVERVDGCYNTVVGLPLCLTAQLLVACGVEGIHPSGAQCRHSSL